ncbi:BLOC-1-related complex subunit 7 [Camponotus japonicus]
MSYNSDDIIEQQRKRSKITKEMPIADIASSIGHITKSIESMSASYSEILRINKNVVTYLQKVEESEKGINHIVADTSIKEKQ